ncbi:MAG: hypothetical protein EOP62_02940 [Sphingomonadales bacterium]|nr:MAG: hypothetical protein EOP62_02940 [Sphingomonadales bacterium]
MKAVELSLHALDACDTVFGHLHMWNDVRKAMVPMIEQSNSSRDAMVTDKVAATKFVISVVARYVEQQIGTGNFHVYRGTLGLHGQSVRHIAETALSYLEENGAISHDSYMMRLERLGRTVEGRG